MHKNKGSCDLWLCPALIQTSGCCICAEWQWQWNYQSCLCISSSEINDFPLHSSLLDSLMCCSNYLLTNTQVHSGSSQHHQEKIYKTAQTGVLNSKKFGLCRFFFLKRLHEPPLTCSVTINPLRTDFTFRPSCATSVCTKCGSAPADSKVKSCGRFFPVAITSTGDLIWKWPQTRRLSFMWTRSAALWVHSDKALKLIRQFNCVSTLKQTWMIWSRVCHLTIGGLGIIHCRQTSYWNEGVQDVLV